MKVFFVVRNHFPNGLATTARVINYCRGFIENKIECEVIIPVAIERYEEPVKNKYSKGVYKNIPYRYISNSTRRSKYLYYRKIKDIIDYLKTLLYLFIYVKRNDVVLVYEAGLIWASFLEKVVHIKHAKICLELNELPYGTGVESEKTKQQRERMLKNVFPKYDAFIAISQELFALAKSYSPNSEVLKVPIIVDTHIADNVVYKTYNRPFLFHSGSLYEQKDGISGMLEGFALANQKLGYKLDYILTGDLQKSRDSSIIKSIIKKYNIEPYVHFVGYLDQKQLREYQKNCVAMIINKEDTQQNRYCFSTKLGEYLSFAKPVIITNIGEAMFYLDNTNSFIIDQKSPQQISESIIRIITNPQKAEEVGQNGLKLAQSVFNYKFQGQRICQFFRDLNKNNH